MEITRRVPRPLVVLWNITQQCNLNCKHCYSRNGMSTQEMSTDDALKCVDMLFKFGVRMMNFGGGEPTLRSDIYRIAEYARSVNMQVMLSSNGKDWTMDTISKVVKSGICAVEISLDSPIAEIHDGFRNSDGLFDEVMSTLNLLADNNINTHLATVVSKLSHKNIEQLIQIALDYNIIDIDIHEYVGAKQELDLTKSEWHEFYKSLQVMIEKYPSIRFNYNDPLASLVLGKKKRRMFTGCMCGKLSFCMRPNGDLTPCVFCDSVAGNIMEDELSDVWYNTSLFQRYRMPVRSGECGTCESSELCGNGGCPSRRLMINHDIDSADPHCWLSKQN